MEMLQVLCALSYTMCDAKVGETDVDTVRIYIGICVFLHSSDTRFKKVQSGVFLVLLVARRRLKRVIVFLSLCCLALVL